MKCDWCNESRDGDNFNRVGCPYCGCVRCALVVCERCLPAATNPIGAECRCCGDFSDE